MLGAMTVGSTAWARVAILTEPALGGGGLGPAQSPIGAATTAGDSTGPSSFGRDQREYPAVNTIAIFRSLSHFDRAGQSLRQTRTP